MQITAPDDDSLINIVATLSPESSKTTLRSWIKEGRITIDDAPAKRADQPVKKGQIVALGAKHRFADQDKKLKILYEMH